MTRKLKHKEIQKEILEYLDKYKPSEPWRFVKAHEVFSALNIHPNDGHKPLYYLTQEGLIDEELLHASQYEKKIRLNSAGHEHLLNLRKPKRERVWDSLVSDQRVANTVAFVIGAGVMALIQWIYTTWKGAPQ